MELIKKRIHYVREGKKIFDQFYVDEEYNVPEAKEDVRRIVDTGTELKIEEIRPVENYVRITGKLYFRILYLNVSSDPKPGVLEVTPKMCLSCWRWPRSSALSPLSSRRPCSTTSAASAPRMRFRPMANVPLL